MRTALRWTFLSLGLALGVTELVGLFDGQVGDTASELTWGPATSNPVARGSRSRGGAGRRPSPTISAPGWSAAGLRRLMTDLERAVRRAAVIGKVRRIYRRRALSRPQIGWWIR